MDRSEIIKSIIESSDFRRPYGNSIWVVKDGKIEYHTIKSEEGKWIAIKYDESAPPPDLTCPIKFLDITMPVNAEWRERVREYKGIRQRRLKEIRTLFRKHKDKKIRVFLRPMTPGNLLNVEVLDVEDIENNPKGRAFNGKLYTIPMRLIDRIEVISPNSPIGKRKKKCTSTTCQ